MLKACVNFKNLGLNAVAVLSVAYIIDEQYIVVNYSGNCYLAEKAFQGHYYIKRGAL
jgi:hypothetical protein